MILQVHRFSKKKSWDSNPQPPTCIFLREYLPYRDWHIYVRSLTPSQKPLEDLALLTVVNKPLLLSTASWPRNEGTRFTFSPELPGLPSFYFVRNIHLYPPFKLYNKFLLPPSRLIEWCPEPEQVKGNLNHML